MKVSQLISRLQQLDPSLEIRLGILPSGKTVASERMDEDDIHEAVTLGKNSLAGTAVIWPLMNDPERAGHR